MFCFDSSYVFAGLPFVYFSAFQSMLTCSPITGTEMVSFLMFPQSATDLIAQTKFLEDFLISKFVIDTIN